MQDSNVSLDYAVIDIVDQLQRSVDKFNQVAQLLLSMVDQDEASREKIIKYIKLLEFNMTGNYFWT